MSAFGFRFKKWLGWYPKTSEPSVVLYGDSLTDFEDAQPLIRALQQSGGRLDVVLVSKQVCVWQGQEVLPLPMSFGPAMALFLSRLKVRCVVALGDLPDGLKAVLGRRGTPIVGPAIVGPAHEAIEIVKIVGRERAWSERSNRPIGRYLANKLFARIQTGNGQAGGIKRFNSLAALKQRLGAPKRILCLGNGPSSEEERVRGVAYDALFRANHSWQSRGVLDKPDMVFTGMQASMKKIHEAVLCVLGETTEKVLLMVRAKNFFLGMLDYTVAGPTGSVLPIDTNADFRPTSGAVMVAMAVALNPEKLVIGGIDMFAHPDGAYPGDDKTTNAYTATHSYDHELAFILNQLDAYSGELVILSDILAKEWAMYKGASSGVE